MDGIIKQNKFDGFLYARTAVSAVFFKQTWRRERRKKQVIASFH